MRFAIALDLGDLIHALPLGALLCVGPGERLPFPRRFREHVPVAHIAVVGDGEDLPASL